MKSNFLLLFLLGLLALHLPACAPASTPPEKSEASAGAKTGTSFTRPTIGANYNEFFEQINFRELEKTNTRWVRGFLDFYELYEEPSLENNTRVKKFLSLKPNGYHTVLNLKFNFKKNKIPRKGSEQWQQAFAFLDKLLSKVIAGTDVLVVGNEPFLEANLADHEQPLNEFYQAAAAHVHQYFVQHRIEKPIFIGAILNAYLPENRNSKGIEKLLEFAKVTPYIAGVDVHVHHSEDHQMDSSLDFVTQRIRENQKILVTEFSLVRRWRQHLKDSISTDFIKVANQNSHDEILPPPAGAVFNYQYIDFAIKNPRSLQEWNAFNDNSPGLRNSKHYLCQAFNKFRSYPHFWLAFHAVRQQFPPKGTFGTNTTPWILNGVLVNRTVALKNGEPQGRYGYFEDYRAINGQENPCVTSE